MDVRDCVGLRDVVSECTNESGWVSVRVCVTAWWLTGFACCMCGRVSCLQLHVSQCVPQGLGCVTVCDCDCV